MPLESATYISDFVVTNPDGTTDTVASLDNHIRMMKQAEQNTWPNISGAVTATHTELNYVDGVTSAIQTQLDAKAPTASPALTGTPTAPTAATGTATTQIATTAFVDNTAFAVASGLTAASQAEMEAGTEAAQRTMSPLRVSQAIASLGYITPFFGDGSDGNVTISAGTTTLTRNMYYNNLTINGTGSLDPAGYQVYVLGTLDLTAAPAGAIKRTALSGGAASGAAPGAAASAMAEVLAGGSGQGLVGKGSTTPTASTQAVKSAVMLGGLSGATKTAGTGASGAGGAGAAKPSAVSSQSIQSLGPLVVASVSALAQGGVGGAGGPNGGNSAGNNGGGGGGGGSGGGVLDIRAATISRGASTTASAIQAIGGGGGTGAAGPTANTGGGSGGAGGGGGFIQIVYAALSGATATNCIDVSGGAGGNGGAGNGTGTAGQGADGGDGGRVRIINTQAGTITENVSAVTGSANTTTTGGAGGVARYDL